ncbi:MAG: 2-oxo acid dehydrogenase subunit E2 [Candidatus Xiphinematobacter sp.]|nr:MAG: 2-oxo acid dehydrogenase subunit E2 [Candidatus Xiphinematobacter sp.]QQY11450.1 MAG: 2-oxo acid dehydrogenase subunit E2 [Candidatus Xiphinematobacter sp.]
MLQVPITMPQLGESIAEATVVDILCPEGSPVEAGCSLMEVETHKALMEITTPCSGSFVRITAQVGQSYPVGSVLGYVQVIESEAQQLGMADKQAALSVARQHSNSTPTKKVVPTVERLPVPAQAGGASYLSPRIRARMNELGLHAADLAGIAGSGAAGRVTIRDLEQFLVDLERSPVTPASPMRIAVADAMCRSWTRPLATVVLPVVLDPLLAHRKEQQEKPGLTLYALRALALALSENSALAGRLVGRHIIHPQAINIGFAVEAKEGVLVPVIHNADRYRLMSLVGRYRHLVDLAQQRKLSAKETGGSIATVTNYGVFGLTLATPIPLPEQALLLGMGMGRIFPKWDAKTREWLPENLSEFTLSFDHRVLDGGAAGRLLRRVGELLLEPETI